MALGESKVLAPGLPDLAANFRDRFYHFSSEEAQAKFTLSPQDYLPMVRPPSAPPARIVMIGPKGAGQSVQARKLAQQHGLVHVRFDAYVQTAGRDKAHPFFTLLQDHVAEPEDAPLETEAALELIKSFWSTFEQGLILEGFPRNGRSAR